MKNNPQVLLIDDEAQVRTFVATALQNDGWETSEAESAEHAFELLHDQEWSAVFCDVMLGGADGYSVLRRFKEELPKTKVVLMTGHGSAAGALDATAFGAYDYLLKPFGVDELQSLSHALREQFSQSPGASSDRQTRGDDVPVGHRSGGTQRGVYRSDEAGGTRGGHQPAGFVDRRIRHRQRSRRFGVAPAQSPRGKTFRRR